METKTTVERAEIVPAKIFIETYQSMVKNDKTYSDIAEALGCQKNAVVMRVQNINKAWKKAGLTTRLPSPKREAGRGRNKVDWVALASLVSDTTSPSNV